MSKNERERRNACLLNDASAYGLRNENLTPLIDDYFNAADDKVRNFADVFLEIVLRSR